jgi:hypothetical protein
MIVRCPSRLYLFDIRRSDAFGALLLFEPDAFTFFERFESFGLDG